MQSTSKYFGSQFVPSRKCCKYIASMSINWTNLAYWVDKMFRYWMLHRHAAAL